MGLIAWAQGHLDGQPLGAIRGPQWGLKDARNREVVDFALFSHVAAAPRSARANDLGPLARFSRPAMYNPWFCSFFSPNNVIHHAFYAGRAGRPCPEPSQKGQS
jgi:hypothetical protein